MHCVPSCTSPCCEGHHKTYTSAVMEPMQRCRHALPLLSCSAHSIDHLPSQLLLLHCPCLSPCPWKVHLSLLTFWDSRVPGGPRPDNDDIDATVGSWPSSAPS